MIRVFFNFDEMPGTFSGTMNNDKTLDRRGNTAIHVATDPNWDRRNSSFIPVLAVVKRQLGWEPLSLPCALLLRRDARTPWLLNPPAGLACRRACLRCRHDAVCVASQLLPWLNNAVKASGFDDKPCLSVDSASGHISRTMTSSC